MGPGRTYELVEFIDVPLSAGFLLYGQGPWTGPGYEYRIPAA
jgi:hypothetical protein